MEDIIIRGPLTRSCPEPAPAGDHKEKKYHLTRDENYNSIYTEYDEVDIDEYVGSFEAGCSLKSILERCNLLPVYDKVRYLQQTSDGVSADLTSMPKDGTEAFIMLNKVKESHPDVYARFAAGEPFDSILKSIMPTGENNTESEVTDNGEA
jgi:hypothetical protein